MLGPYRQYQPTGLFPVVFLKESMDKLMCSRSFSRLRRNTSSQRYPWLQTSCPSSTTAFATSEFCSNATAQAKKVDLTLAALKMSMSRHTPTREPYSFIDSMARFRMFGGTG